MSDSPPYSRLKRQTESRAHELMAADHDRLRRTLRSLGNHRFRQPEQIQRTLAGLQNQLDASRRRVRKRDQSVPSLLFPAQLPISAKQSLIVEAIRKHQTVVITGETGSGKTTQLPKMCLAAGRGRRGIIGLTQPRRIAAVSIASRIAEELGSTGREAVAYKIRFEEKTSTEPLIKVMTDGILLAETVQDRDLLAYDTIIVDEAHERSLNIDFILGYLRTLLARRKDLKLIITSATIDTAKFAEAFDQAQVIEVSGRMYPVEVRYRPLDPVREEKGETTCVDEAIACVEDLQRNRRFEDILIFLPTEQDIRETCERLAKRCSGLILPLYARLSAGQQRLVFAPAEDQKIIVATNIAETSLTIPGIKYVIDAGLARILEYNPRSQTTGLPVKAVSRSSAEQRKGRCGRVQDGICIRLYSREDFAERPLYTTPEILRSNLSGVILRMLALNLGSVHSFPFIDRPQPKNIRDGIDILRDLGALTRKEDDTEAEQFELTPIGRTMAKFPLDPRVSRMMIEARKEECVNEIAVIAAALSIQDPRERPYDKLDQAAAAHARFQHPESDFLTFLQIWNQYSASIEKKQSQGKLRKFCRDHFLSYRRMTEWRDIYHQILDIANDENSPPKKRRPATIELDQQVADKIHRCILSGYLSNIARKSEKNMYTAAKSREVMLHPGSGLFNRGGPWIVASEISLTSRVFARNTANIKSEWLEELGREHCRYTYSSAHWEKNRGQVVALEKVILFGLTIVESRTVAYEKVHPEQARGIFIREALVTGEVSQRLPFLAHNLTLWENAKTMEDKLRKRGIAVDEETVAALYEQRLPLISDIRSLQKLIRDKGGDEFLRFREEDFIAHSPDDTELNAYPDQIKIGSAALPCSYQFEPGAVSDGVTVTVPLGLVSKAASENVEKHLPSLLQEKALYLLKSLPKQARKKLPPLAWVASTFSQKKESQGHPLPLALSKFLSGEYQITVPVDSWTPDKLPQHLNIRYRVVDDTGSEMKSGRDIVELEKELTGRIQEMSLDSCRSQWEKDGITGWTFGTLPEQIELRGKHGVAGYAYPALLSEDGNIGIRLFSNPREAAISHVEGVAALYERVFTEKLKQLKKNVGLSGELKNNAARIGNFRQIEQSIVNRVKKDLFSRPWRSPDDFHRHEEIIGGKILPCGQQVIEAVTPVITGFADIDEALQKLMQKNRINSPALQQFLKNTLAEAHKLVPVDFPELYTFDRLRHLPRYLKALSLRAERGILNPAGTQAKLQDVAVYENNYSEMLNNLTETASPEKKNKIDDLRWMIEEYKVSLFAQELKTPYPVSPKRLQQAIRDILNMIY